MHHYVGGSGGAAGAPNQCQASPEVTTTLAGRLCGGTKQADSSQLELGRARWLASSGGRGRTEGAETPGSSCLCQFSWFPSTAGAGTASQLMAGAWLPAGRMGGR